MNNNIINIILLSFLILSLYNIFVMDNGKENFIGLNSIKRVCNKRYYKTKRMFKKNINKLKIKAKKKLKENFNFSKKIMKGVFPKEINIKF